MDQSSGPEAPRQDGPETGEQSETLDWIKLRKKHLNFRWTLLLKGQKFRKTLPGIQEEEQINELAAIKQEVQELTAKQRQLGFYEDNDDLSLAAELQDEPVTEEMNHWPPPPPCVLVSDAKGTPVPVNELGLEPAVTQCPGCGQVVTTEIVKNIGDAAWILCCMVSLFGCVGGCCLIPFFLSSLKDVHHGCPNCHTKIFKNEKM